MASSDWADETEQRDQLHHTGGVPARRAVIGKAFEQRSRQTIPIDRRHERGACDLPERARCEAVAPPCPPALDRPAIDASQPGQLPYAGGSRALPHDRYEHHHRGEIDFAAEKPQRRRRRPLAAAVHGAAEAETPIVLLAQLAETAAGLAAVARGMQCTVAQCASRASCGLGKIPVDGEQQLVESGAGQQGLVQGMHPSQLEA